METTEMKQFNPFVLAGTDLKAKVESIKVESFEDVEIAKEILKECTELEKKIEDTRTSITKPVNDMLKQINSLAKEVSIPVNEAKLSIKQKMLTFNEEQEKIRKEEEKRIQGLLEGMQKIFQRDLLDGYFKGLEEKDQNNFIIKTAYEKQIVQIADRIRQAEEEKLQKEEQARLDEEKKKMSEEQAKLAQEKADIEKEKREIELQKQKEAEEKALAEKEKVVAQINKTEPEKVKGIRTVKKREIIDENLVPQNLCSPDSKKINEFLKNFPSINVINGLRIWEEKAIQ